MMPGREGKEVVPENAVLAAGEPEGGQVAFLDPSQDGYLADAALPGDGPGGEIDRVGLLRVRIQLAPPEHRQQRTRMGETIVTPRAIVTSFLNLL
jgi:hypothetical protein